ncbi:MAG: hypothetical protein ACKVK3_16445 [Acidimicrobiales bacterium]
MSDTKRSTPAIYHVAVEDVFSPPSLGSQDTFPIGHARRSPL